MCTRRKDASNVLAANVLLEWLEWDEYSVP